LGFALSASPLRCVAVLGSAQREPDERGAVRSHGDGDRTGVRVEAGLREVDRLGDRLSALAIVDALILGQRRADGTPDRHQPHIATEHRQRASKTRG